MWGVPVIPTSALIEDTFLVGAFDQAALIYDRMDPRIDISLDDDQNFTKNLATVRGEERLGLAILRPTALVKGDLNVSGA
jgi:HK97 family phage major capsid protein